MNKNIKNIILVSAMTFSLFSCKNKENLDYNLKKDECYNKITFNMSFLNEIKTMSINHLYWFGSEKVDFPNYSAEIKNQADINQITSSFRECTYYAKKNLGGEKGYNSMLSINATFLGSEDKTFMLYTFALPGFSSIGEGRNIPIYENSEVVYKKVHTFRFSGSAIKLEKGYEEFKGDDFEYLAVFKSDESYRAFINAIKNNTYEK